MTNELQQAILDAMQLVGNKAVDSTTAPIVIKGEVIEEIDESTHQYSIFYGGVVYSDVYSIAGAKYSASTVVNVIIPDGNYSNVKYILGSIEPTANNYVVENESDFYVNISDNILGKNRKDIELKTWHSEEIDLLDSKDPYITNITNFPKLFKDYADSYKTFCFSANIKTDIDINHQNQGDYGLKLTIPIINTKTNQEDTKVFSITTKNIEGDPYKFELFQRVNIYFTLDDEWNYNTNKGYKFKAFVKDFNYDKDESDALDKSGKTADIIINDVSFVVVEVLSEEELGGYHVNLVSSDGNYFLAAPYDVPKTLTPILKIKGKTSNIEDWDCYWFVQDSSITTASKNYLRIGGIGWKCLNQKINEGNDYIKNVYSQIVTSEDVKVELRYKCVLTKVIKISSDKEDTIVTSGVIRLRNLSSRVNFSLSTVTGSNIFAENIGNVELSAKIITDTKIFNEENYGYDLTWQRFDRNNNFINEENFYNVTKPLSLIKQEEKQEGTKKVTYYTYETRISFPCSLIDKSNTIYCTFYEVGVENKLTNLGTRSILITTSKEKGYTLKIINADVLYKYDSDGDSPRIANYDGPISSQIKTIQPISFQVFKPDGYELSDEEYKMVHCKWTLPANSLLKYTSFSSISPTILDDGQSYYIIENIININYNIDNQYNKQKANNNNIKLEVDYDGNKLIAMAHPKFMKDGEGGTNGSKYAAIIKYQDYAYGEYDEKGISRKLHMIWVADKKKWYYHDQVNDKLIQGNPSAFTLDFFKDGERDSRKKTIKWSIFGSNDHYTNKINCFTINTNGQLQSNPKVVWDKSEEIPWTIVECQITVENETSSLGIDNQEIIFAYYPIEVTYLPELLNSETSPMVPTLIGGFNEVLYDIAGNNPEWDQEKIYVKDKSELSNKYNFCCENNIENLVNNSSDQEQYYTYNWYISNWNLDKKENFGKYAYIVPKTKYQSGVSFNYIKVDYTWDAKYRESIKEKIEKLKNQIEKVENIRKIHIGTYKENKSKKGNYQRKQYENGFSEDYAYIYMGDGKQDYDLDKKGNRQYIESLYQNWFGNYQNWTTNLLNTGRNVSFLERINLALVSLDKMQDILQYLKDYCEEKEKNRGALKKYYENIISELNIAINNNRQGIYYLGNFDNEPTELETNFDLIIQANGQDYSIAIDENQNTNISIDQINQVNDYARDWAVNVRNYNKCVNTLRQRNDGSGVLYYTTAYNNLYKFKHQLNKMMTSTEYTSLKGEETETKEEDKSTFYDDNGNVIIDTLFIDSFKKNISNLNNILLPPNPDKIDIRNWENKLYGYKDYYNKIIEPVLKVIYMLYKNSMPEGKDIQNQQLFYFYLDEHRKNKNKYETLLQDTQKNTKCIHVKPILMTTNKAGLGFINQWDGNRLYIDEDNAQYIMAPIMGAGQKNKGLFTGLVMGIQTLNSTTNKKEDQLIGLRGYSSSEISLFLNAKDGSAVFGKSGDGQIIIDPRQPKEGKPAAALLYSSNYFENLIGADGKPTAQGYNTIGKGSYKIGEGPTIVREGTLLNLSEGYIHFGTAHGKIYSGSHDEIGSPNEGIYFSNDGLSIGENFIVYAKKTKDTEGNEHIKGESHLEQIGSTLSRWKVQKHEIYVPKLTNEGKHIVDKNNEWVWDKKEQVGLISKNNSGIFMDAESGTIVLGSTEGRIYSGAHYNLNSTEKGFYLSHDGISIGTDFTVSSNGVLSANQKNSSIGQWRIREKEIWVPMLDEDGNHLTKDKKIAKTFDEWGWIKKKQRGLISGNNSGIFMDAPSGTIVLGSEEGRIYSGQHYLLTSNTNGFYLSADGLAIGSNFVVSADSTAMIGKEGSKIAGWNVEVNEDGNLGFSSRNGGIFMDSKSSTIVLGDAAGKIYSGSHSTLNSTREGFYIDNKGLSIWDSFRIEKTEIIDSDGYKIDTSHLKIGQIKGKHWTIGGANAETELVWKGIIVEAETSFYDIPIDTEFLWKITATSLAPYGMIWRTIKEIKNNEHIRPGENCILVDDGNREEEKWRYKKIDSYISYNTEKIGVTLDSNEDLLTGETYNNLIFDRGTGNNQVYLGTDGLRIGRMFAVAIQENERGLFEANATFKGNIEAKHGSIGGWQISDKGLYNIIGSSKPIWQDVNLDCDNKEKKEKLLFQKAFIISEDGNIGIMYAYVGKDTKYAWYRDGDNNKKSKTLTHNSLIGIPLMSQWFDRSGWFGYNDDSFDIYGEGSHFGGVYIKHDGTHYDTEEDLGAEAFGSGMQKAVRETAKDIIPDMSKYYVYLDSGIKAYLNKD